MPNTTMSLKTLQRSTSLLIFTALFLMISMPTTTANPIDSSWNSEHSKTDKVQDDCGLRGESQIQALCQRCAKSTKSPVVYPMCCENREDARQWCQRYMAFGIHSEDTRHNMDT